MPLIRAQTRQEEEGGGGDVTWTSQRSKQATLIIELPNMEIGESKLREKTSSSKGSAADGSAYFEGSVENLADQEHCLEQQQLSGESLYSPAILEEQLHAPLRQDQQEEEEEVVEESDHSCWRMLRSVFT
eukprot:TRINITY_DN8428_c0_g2_i1.p1 TRINITY_DN8428_c0_g2~~TRINITY_DN8428_c0_g2_i1.p1  ORF type:complete len:130 (-),score=33.57 TRINITY_DN8428_c0_g2_i1:55-444(-)